MKRYKLNFFLVLSLAQMGLCSGASFVVGNGETETATQFLADPGDTGLIEPRGTIATMFAGDNAVSMQNVDQVVTNEGTITTDGQGAAGIASVGPNATIRNKGSITTNLLQANGIASSGANATISNSGSIATEGNVDANGIITLGANVMISNSGSISVMGDSSDGINNSGANATISNSGSITVMGESSNGIINTGANAAISNSGSIATKEVSSGGIESIANNSRINNSGSIATEKNGSHGIAVDGENAIITNTGSITTKGDGAEGITTFNDLLNASANIKNNGSITTEGVEAHGIMLASFDNTVFNCGTIATSGTDADGIRTRSIEVNANITNAGTISSKKGFALNLLGANPTLTIHKCSKMIGPVHSATALNVNTKKGVNLLLTLDDTSVGFGELNIEGFHAVRDNTLAVIDPRSFVMQPDVVADLSDTLLNGVDNPCYICNCGTSCATWAQGIGSIRERGKDCHRYEFHQGGFLVGLDASFCQGSRLTVFGGAVFGHNNKKGCGVCLKSDNYVGGLRYENCLCLGTWSYSGVFGSLSLDQTRPVFFNLAADGILDAKSSRSGFFTAQEFNLQQCFRAWCVVPEVTATVRYAGFFPGEVKEHGESSFPNVCTGEADLVLKKQSINFVTTRLLVALPYYSTCFEQSLKVEPYLGAAGRFQLDGLRQKGKFFDESVCFSSYLPCNIASFLFGIKGCYSLCGLDCSLNLEGVTEGAHGSRFVGTGGVSYSY